MKTTVEIPDNLYRQIKSHAASRGQTIKAFLIDALRDKLGKVQPNSEKEETGWRAAFGKGDKEAIEDVQRIIDEEFSQIDYAEWGFTEPDSQP